MEKVKEFLDANFKHKNTSAWIYTIKQNKGLDYKSQDTFLLDNCISCYTKYESLYITIIINGVKAGHYDHVTTSIDEPLGEPDERGFHNRWTEGEVIYYIKFYMDVINQYK